jgi:hypothetical protein
MSTPKNLITFEAVKKNIETYRDNVLPKISGQTQSVWFSLDEMKKFIAYIESFNSGYQVSGLRFYITANKDEKNAMSTIVSPTFNDSTSRGTSKDRSFDPSRSKPGKPVLLSTLINEGRVMTELSSVLAADNECPRICPQDPI